MMRAFNVPWLLQLFLKPPLVPLLIVSLFVDGFWSFGNLHVLLESIAVDGLVVAGLTVVMIAGGFDLAIGAVMAVGGVAAVVLLPYGLPVSFGGGIGFGMSAGLAAGLLVTRLQINAFIATLAVMVIARGAVLAYTETRPVISLDDTFLVLGGGWPFPYAFIVLVCVLVVLHLALTTRPWGRHIYAVGADERAAAMAGLRVRWLKLGVYVLSGALAGLAGFMLSARLGTGSPIIGETTPLTAAAAALIGGATLRGGEGSIVGAFYGLLFIGALVNIMNLLILPAYYQQMAIGLLLIGLVAVEGLPGRLMSWKVPNA